MWDLLTKLFAEEAKPKAVVEEPVVASRSLVVGEPVMSLAKSMLETDDWVVDNDSDRYYQIVTFHHTEKALDVAFTRYTGYRGFGEKVFRCTLNWLTTDEHEYMMQVFATWQAQEADKANRERLRQQADEREKFMVLVNK